MSRDKDGDDFVLAGLLGNLLAGDGDDVMEFTPVGGFDIKSAARDFARLMRNTHQAIILHLPHVSVEFEPGCTAKEIIDGYHFAMKKKPALRPSNVNRPD